MCFSSSIHFNVFNFFNKFIIHLIFVQPEYKFGKQSIHSLSSEKSYYFFLLWLIFLKASSFFICQFLDFKINKYSFKIIISVVIYVISIFIYFHALFIVYKDGNILLLLSHWMRWFVLHHLLSSFNFLLYPGFHLFTILSMAVVYLFSFIFNLSTLKAVLENIHYPKYQFIFEESIKLFIKKLQYTLTSTAVSSSLLLYQICSICLHLSWLNFCILFLIF